MKLMGNNEKVKMVKEVADAGVQATVRGGRCIHPDRTEPDIRQNWNLLWMGQNITVTSTKT